MRGEPMEEIEGMLREEQLNLKMKKHHKPQKDPIN